jgi:DNA invertase Pin-like site-specific DNA recombinase
MSLSPLVELYMRVSSDEQTERGTIASQREFLRSFASLYDHPIIGEYADEGISDARCPFHKFATSQAAARLYGLGG